MKRSTFSGHLTHTVIRSSSHHHRRCQYCRLFLAKNDEWHTQTQSMEQCDGGGGGAAVKRNQKACDWRGVRFTKEEELPTDDDDDWQ